MNKENKLVCKECGREFKNFCSLSGHIVRGHKILLKKYYDDHFKIKNSDEDICLQCGKKTDFAGLTGGYYRYCSRKCMVNSEEIKEKINQTNKEKNEKNPNRPKEILKTRQQTEQELNEKNPNRLKKIKESYKQTWNKKSDYELKITKEKRNKTNLEKNKKDPSRLEKIDKKSKITLKKNYGKKGLTNLKIKEKREKSCKIKFGYKNPSQSPEINQLKIETFQKNYGENNWSSSTEGISFHKNRVRKVIEFGLKDMKKFTPFHGKNEELVFNEIQCYIFPYKLLEDQERGGCWADRLIEEDIKAAFELDGDDHEQQFLKEKDKRKDKVYISLGFMPIRIKESDWFEDKELQIIKVQETINFLKQVQELN